MREKINVKEAIVNENQEVLLKVEDTVPINQLEAIGQVLVDSDQLSFIYLAEKNNEYVYIVLNVATWPAIKRSINQDLDVFITNGSTRLKLVNIQEELNYLIENIQGNSNYGEEMISKVEEIF